MPSMWKKAMVYLGLADDEEYADYGEYEEVEQQGPTPHGQHGSFAQSSHQQYPPAQHQGNPYPSEPSPVRVIQGRDEQPYPAAAELPPFQSSAVRTIPPQPAARLSVVN